MFRFTFAMVACLAFAVPSQAFFTELVQSAETLLATHEVELKKGEKSAEELAEGLDKKLNNWKELLKETFEKVSKSKLIPAKFKQSLIDALGVLEQEITHKIEDAKKALSAPQPTDL
ncbi:MAG: hypothetical protein WCK49_04890 [Myxococcaceae bacterium]